MTYEFKSFTKNFNALNELTAGKISIHLTDGVYFYDYGYNLNNDELALVAANQATNLPPIVEYQCAVGRKKFEAQQAAIVTNATPPNTLTSSPVITINTANVDSYYATLP